MQSVTVAANKLYSEVIQVKSKSSVGILNPNYMEKTQIQCSNTIAILILTAG